MGVQLELRLRRVGGGRINPRPRGSMSPLACSSQVMALLVAAPGRWFSFGELAARVSHPKALTWALAYLRDFGWVDTGEDARSARYLRYRASDKGLREFLALEVR